MKIFKLLSVAAMVAVLALAPFVAGSLGAQGQSESTGAGPEAGRRVSTTEIPLSKVVLFSSGVGYFQRDGVVEGDSNLELAFRTGDVNDLLKSMITRDFDGGQVAAVTYASRDPVTRTLRSFAIDLTSNPGVAGILTQVRGEAVQIGAPERLTGIIVGVESRPGPEGTTQTFLNLLTEGGLRSVPLEEVEEVRFLDPTLDGEFRQALAVLAQGHSTDRKRVAVRFTGEGRRRVQVGYLLETPVWKTSYRLVLGEADRHFLQGWAIVENTGEEDWQGVSLRLVSGRPISFIMDLYRPLYVPRPVVQPELYSSLRPQRYDEDLSGAERAIAGAAPAEAPMAAPRMKSAPAPSMSLAEAYAEPEAFRDEEALDLSQGVSALAQAGEAGSFFEYRIAVPVTLPRQESAMLPILNQEISGRRVSIYNESVQAKHPLLGLQLTNSTGLELMGGPLTVFEAGSYTGDAQIDNLPAGAERLISFALDLETEVASTGRSLPEELVSVKILRGSLLTTRTLRRELVYTVKNSSRRSREVLIEYPISSDWELVLPPKVEEKTRNLYRFLVSLPAGATAGSVKELSVVEQRKVSQSIALTNLNDDTIAFYLRAREVSPRVKAALEELSARKGRLIETQRARQEEERKLQQIRSEQSRIRQNMDALSRDSSLYKRYVQQLSDQEDQLEKILERIDDLRARELEQQRELEAYMQSLQIE
jgi:hypothetical protein